MKQVSSLGRAVRAAHTLLVGALIAGCGGVEDPGAANFSTVPAKGRVSAGGKPLTKGIIVLEPTADGGSTQQASGEIKTDGTFELTSPGGKSGAMPGTYRVKVESEQVKATKTKGKSAAKPPEPVTVEVKSGQDLVVDLPTG